MLIRKETRKKAVPMAQFRDECVDIPRFLKYCKQCSSFKRSWSCPPFAEDPQQIWQSYDVIHLWGRVLYLEPGTSQAEATKLLWEEQAVLLAELLAMEKQVPGSMALSAGTCHVCESGCTRIMGQPCEYPEKMRYSIEALGGNVSFAAENYLGKKLLWGADGAAPAYQVLVGALLVPEIQTI